jgi:hypothetical protein
MATGTRLNAKILAAPYTVDVQDFLDVLFPAVTTAQLADEDHRINTEDKFVGRMVYESTLGFNYTADGALPASTWTLNDGLGATQVTPS